MKFLHVLRTADPRSGGPIESVLQRGLYLRGMGHEVELATLDSPMESFLSDIPLKTHPLGPSAGFYGFTRKLVPWLGKHADRFDAVISDGLWQYNGLGVWRALRGGRRGYFVYPHGMLDPWFKRTYPLKHLKKWVYWPWAEYRVLRDAKAVIFTTDEERSAAEESFWLYRVKPRVVAIGTGAPSVRTETAVQAFYVSHPELRGRHCLLFLGRIHEKKGCDLLIHALAKVKDLDPNLHLIIAGPDHQGLVEKLKALSSRLGIAERITWPGMLRDTAKWAAFWCSQAFILPSHQENFGVAVAEALACGLPVLISDKVNIWREIEADGAGLVATDSIEGTESNIRRWLALDSQARRVMSEKAVATFNSRYSLAATTEAFLDAIVCPKSVKLTS